MRSHGHGHGTSGPQIPPDQLRRMGYEPRDVGLRAIVVWTAGLFVGTVITGILTLWFYNQIVKDDVETKVAYPLASLRRMPPETLPIVQQNPVKDWYDYAAEQEAKTEKYGWVDRRKG